MAEERDTIDLSKIPLGSWDMQGNWEHNPALALTSLEQYKHNLAAGHFADTEASRLKEALGVSGRDAEISVVREQRKIVAMELYSKIYYETATKERGYSNSHQPLDEIASKEASSAVDSFYAKFP